MSYFLAALVVALAVSTSVAFRWVYRSIDQAVRSIHD